MNPLCGEAVELPRVKEVVLGPGFLRVPAALIGARFTSVCLPLRYGNFCPLLSRKINIKPGIIV